MLNAIFRLAFLTLIAFSAVFTQTSSTASSPRPAPNFPVSELREGMRGTAKTVFRGNKSEEFGVEILGVLPNWIGPKQDLIIGRLFGENAERTFVFAGMSGSPVYIDGKLVGAISYSFPFAKEPICGITPFEQMTADVERFAALGPAGFVPPTFSAAELTSPIWKPSAAIPQTLSASRGGAFETFRPIATPVSFAGISQAVLDMFAPQLTSAGIVPVAAPTGSSSRLGGLKTATPTTLLGGDSVVVHLARGDIQLSAAGTVTARDGDNIYAFGHPFFSLGSSDLPMSESHVVTVVPNANNSFKLAVPDDMVGSMTQDRATGILGQLGTAPKMLPVKINFTSSRGKREELVFESAIDEFLTPLIMSVGVTNILSSNERSIGNTTIDMKGKIRIKGEKPIDLTRRISSGQAILFAGGAPAVPLGALLRANYPGVEIEGIDLDINVSEGARLASVDKIWVDKQQVRPGDNINVSIAEKAAGGKISVRTVPVTIPRDAAPGIVTLTVGDGSLVQALAATTQFAPKTPAAFVETFNGLKKPDRLYVLLTSAKPGLVIGSSELANLPPSVAATLGSDRSAGATKATTNTVLLEMELPQGENIVGGSQTLTLEIIR
ncbi:MAG: hypothetical protein IPM50_05365 [Acidobacteriota bacterium]|nr:MAG: hypothetical protein IPM50_05365 [Acidobacteriota bacterium]